MTEYFSPTLKPNYQDTFEPTEAKPGTARFVAVMAWRVENGYPLWHPDDAKLDNFVADESTPTRRSARYDTAPAVATRVGKRVLRRSSTVNTD